MSVYVHERIDIDGGGRGRYLDLVRGSWAEHAATKKRSSDAETDGRMSYLPATRGPLLGLFLNYSPPREFCRTVRARRSILVPYS